MKRMVFLIFGVICALLCGANGVAEQALGFTAVIDGRTANRVHLRTEPSTKAASMGLYFSGTAVYCETVPAPDWTKVVIGAQTGYMKSEYLCWGEGAGCVDAAQTFGAVQGEGWVNLRDVPAREGQILKKLYPGDTLRILGETASHWYYVTASGASGYVDAAYVQLLDIPLTGDEAARRERYMRVVQHDEAYYNVSEGCACRLSQRTEGGSSWVAQQYALADVDQDGADEMILSIGLENDPYYGYVVLDDQHGTVFGYDIVYRALMDLKADGSFSFSSGAADSGFGYFELGAAGYRTLKTAYSESTPEGVRYVSHGAQTDEKQYRQLCDHQAEKQSAVWYDLVRSDASGR